MKKLLFLVPTYNPFDKIDSLINSISSCGLKNDLYDILILDNNSTQNYRKYLPDYDKNGAKIIFNKNKENIGRIENWNKAFQLASDLNYSYATYVFTNDILIKNGSIPLILNKMLNDSDIKLSFGDYKIRNQKDTGTITKKYNSKNNFQVFSGKFFFNNSIAKGYLPFGPLQSIIFKIEQGNYLSFDNEYPIVTDVEQIIKFAMHGRGKVLYYREPFFEWKNSKNRMHGKTSQIVFLNEEEKLFKRLKNKYNLIIKQKDVNTLMLLRYGSSIMNFSSNKSSDLIHLIKKYLYNGINIRLLINYAFKKTFKNIKY